MASHQQSVGIDPERRTRHQCDQILVILDLEQARVRGQYRVDGVYLVCQHLTQHMDIEHIALCKLVYVRKQFGACHAAVCRQHRVGAAAAYRQ